MFLPGQVPAWGVRRLKLAERRRAAELGSHHGVVRSVSLLIFHVFPQNSSLKSDRHP